MSIRKRRKDGSVSPPLDPVAGNGLLDRRILLGRGIMFAGATTTGVGALLTGAAAEPLKNDPWSEEIGAMVPSIQVPSRFEKNVVRTLSNPDRDFRTSHAHAAPPAAGHGHTQQPVLLDLPYSHPRHRPGPAQAGDPRPGQAADGLHARHALALPDGDAHAFCRVCRQQRTDVLQ